MRLNFRVASVEVSASKLKCIPFSASRNLSGILEALSFLQMDPLITAHSAKKRKNMPSTYHPASPACGTS